MGQFWTLVGLLWAMKNAFTTLTTNAFTGVTTNGNNQVTNLSSTAGLAIGQFIVGAGIPAGTTISAINTGASSLTLSANATATSTTGAPTSLWSYGTAGQALALTVHLLTGQVPTGEAVSWNQLTEATYDGYLPQTATSPVFSSPDAGAHGVVSFENMTFTPSDYNVPNTITGMAWTYTAVGASSPTLVAVEPFASPIGLTEAGDLIRLIPILNLPTDQLQTNASPLLS